MFFLGGTGEEDEGKIQLLGVKAGHGPLQEAGVQLGKKVP